MSSVDSRPGESTTPASDRPGLAWMLPAAVVLAVLAALSLSIDAWFVVWINTWAGDGMWPRRLLKWPRLLFEWWTPALLAAWLVWRAAGWSRLTAAAMSFAGTLVTVHGLKILVGRGRPELDHGPFRFAFPGDSLQGFDSFPSGHTANAVLLAVLIGLYWRGSRWVLVPAAVLVALGRVAQERHYLSDTLVAAAIALIWIYLPWRWLGAAAFAPLHRADQAGAAPSPSAAAEDDPPPQAG